MSVADPPATYPEDVREAFEYCEDCEKVVARLDGHTCPDDSGSRTGHKSAAERARLAQLDDRPHDEEVLYPKGRSNRNAWAYHELDEDGDPLHEVQHAGGSERGTREEAINEGCYPCGKCRTLQEQRGGPDGG